MEIEIKNARIVEWRITFSDADAAKGFDWMVTQCRSLNQEMIVFTQQEVDRRKAFTAKSDLEKEAKKKSKSTKSKVLPKILRESNISKLALRLSASEKKEGDAI